MINAAVCLAPPVLNAQVSHTNPVSGGADPFLIRHAGNYYFLRTTGSDIKIRRSDTLQGIGSGIESAVFWFNHEIKGHIWAPELHYLNGKWYIYATGSLSSSQHIMRMFVLEGNSQDPMGPYTYRGLLEAHTGALDQSPLVRDSDGALFLIWSQWDDAGQSLYIGPMSDPLTLGHPRVRISTPDYPWERNGAVNEGPIVLKRGDRTMIVYSGSGTWTPDYCLGMLVNSGNNYLDPDSWVKASNPIFRRRDANNVFCVGHNGFTESPSGNQSWIAYHATSDPTGNQEPKRNTRIQRFGWWSNNTPNLDVPVAAGTQQISPDEAPGAPERGLHVEFFNNQTLTGTPAVKGVTRTMDFNWGTGSPVFGVNHDKFSGRWTGTVYAPISGIYTFETASNGGVRLWLRDEQVIDRWNNQVAATTAATVYLEGGQFHPLRLEYLEELGSAQLALRWLPPAASAPVVIPAENLFPAASGLRGDYFSGASFDTHVLTRLDPTVAFNWGASIPDLGLPADGFSVRWSGRVRPPASGNYTFHTRSDDGVRLWVAGGKLVDDWKSRPVTENSGTVHLNAGEEYDLTLEYFDHTGGALCELLWTPPGGTKATIPSSALFPPGCSIELPEVPPGDSLWIGTIDGQFGTAGNWTAGVPAETADVWFGNNALTTAVSISSHPNPRTLRKLRFMPGTPAITIANGGGLNGDRLDLTRGGGIEIQAGMSDDVNLGGLGFFRLSADREIRITHNGTGLLTLPANISRTGNLRLTSVRIDGSGDARANVFALTGGTVTKTGTGTLELAADLADHHATRLDVRDSGTGRVHLAAGRSISLADLGLAANRTLAGPTVKGQSATLILNNAAGTIHGSMTGNLAVIKKGTSTFTVASSSTSTAAQSFNSLEIREGVWKTERLAGHAPSSKVGTGPVTVLAGASLELAGSDANETGGYPNALTLAGTTANNGRGALTSAGSGDKHWNGSITLSGPARISHGTNASFVLAGPLSSTGHTLELDNDLGTIETRGNLALGGGTLLKQGGGLAVLAGPSNTSGPVSIATGTLRTVLANGSTLASPSLEVASGARFEFLVSDGTSRFVAPTNRLVTGAGTFAKTGPGELELSAGPERAGATLALAAGARIVVEAGTLRNGHWNYADWSQNLADLEIAAGAVFDTWNGAPIRVDALSGAGSVVNGLNAGDARLTVGVAGGSGTFGGTLASGSSWGNLFFTKEGAGTQTMAAASSFAGSTTIAGGILRVDHSKALGTGTITIAGGRRLALGNGVALENPVTVAANSGAANRGLVEAAAGTTATIAGAVTILEHAAAGGHFAAADSAVLQVAGPVESSVPVSMGSGTVVFSGGGNYEQFRIEQGKVRLGAAHGLSQSAVLHVATSSTASFELDGFDQQLAGLVSNSSNATVNNFAATTATLTLANAPAASHHFGGTLAGNLALTKRGTGTQVLASANTHTGQVTVTDGTLRIENPNGSATGSGTVQVSGGSLTGHGSTAGPIVLGPSGTLAPDGTLSVAGISGTGSLDLVIKGPTADRLVSTGPVAIGALRLRLSQSAADPTEPFYLLVDSSAPIDGEKFAGVTGLPDGYTLNHQFHDGSDNFNIALVRVVTEPFEAWAAEHGLAGTDTGFLADPDQDGIPNGLEFVLGGQPNPGLPGSDSRHLLPTATLDGDRLVFSYSRNPAAAYLDPVVEFTTDLAGSWIPAVAGSNATAEVIHGVGADTIHTVIPTAGAPRLFARLRVSLLPSP